jgi:uncharacterized protein (DUF1697 family)
MKYLALLRGINVGGKNKIAMSELRQCLSGLGMKNVTTYINSGNVMFESEGSTSVLAKRIETALVQGFKFDSDIIKVLVLTKDELAAVVAKAPNGFGQEPDVYYSDVAFLIGVDDKEALGSFEVNPEVDTIWPGKGVVYYRRLGAKRTKSRLSRVISKPIYKSITIRSWNTTIKLLALLAQNESSSDIIS